VIAGSRFANWQTNVSVTLAAVEIAQHQDYFAGSHLLLGHLTANNVTTVEEFFGRDLVLIKAP